MKNIHIISIWFLLMLNTALCGMGFLSGETVTLVQGSHAGHTATVYFPFAKMWPGDKLKNIRRNGVIASYLDITPEDQPNGIEKYLYCVHVGLELILVHQCWMKKIPTTVNAQSKKEREESKK